MHKILIITNGKKSENSLEDFLNDLGYTCKTAYDGGMGVQMALKFKPDIILSELNLSEFSGFEVYNVLKKIEFMAHIPFVILSSKNREEEILEGLQMGMDGFIAKPIDYFHLESLIRNKLNKINLIKKHYERECNFFKKNPFTGVFTTKNYRFFYSNYRFQKITGYNEKELQKMKLFDILFDEDIMRLTKAINNCVKEIITNIDDEIRFINKSNKIIHTRFYGNVYENGSELEISGNVLPDQNHKEINEMHSDSNNIKLTKREQEVLILICKGYTNQGIADLLFLSERTVEGHRARIMDKTNTKNTVELVKYAIKNKYFKI